MDADYARLIDAIAKLEVRWREQNIPLANPLELDSIHEQIANTGKQVSDDVIKLYSVTGGMLNYEMDDACFTLWSLNYAIERNRELESAHWFFADYLIESFLYAADPMTLQVSSVLGFWTLDEAPVGLAPTLCGFFSRFAEASTDSERFYAIL